MDVLIESVYSCHDFRGAMPLTPRISKNDERCF
jgi:hypothetical protein